MMMRSNGSITRFTQAVLLFALTGCATAPAIQNAAPPSNAAPPTASPPDAIAQAPQSVRAVKVLEGLENPWGMAWLPDGAMLITERPGRLRIVRDGRLDPNPIAGVPNVFAQRQGGLMDVSVHPQFAQNQLIYFTFADGTEQANRTRLARARFDGRSLQDVQVIFEVTQPKPDGQHFGSRIAWLPDGTMLVSIGDGGNPPVAIEGELIRQQAQNLQSRLGKIVRLNDDGSIPSDNPFVNGGGDRAIWSYGHRNIQGLAVDPATNRVWATEHGARGGDELNLVQAGENYGWPLVTHSREYSGGEISPDRSRPGLVDPKQVWSTIAPSGLMVYSGDRVPAWQGNLFAGGLVSQDIRRIEVDAAGNVVNEQTIAIGQRVRDVRQSPEGEIYVLTDAPNGQLLRLEPS
ncbi:PQQ-dependent sugar dehydrogenase [Microcoleus sp. FACHB-1515]|uniref:PQQ-dependent sugar dehydrogenase n=2 Tax=Cyanophyceae TaxID=3028117 RepID=UPI001F5540BE|nr:PQQ-dependent sugar dehydrogenase [Microcoleus sp. FACHB-1515]